MNVQCLRTTFLPLVICTLIVALPTLAADDEPDEELKRLTTANPYERDLADRLLREGPIREYEGDEYHRSRLDSWLARGSLTVELAASRSPKALLAKLENQGIHHESNVAQEYWMLRQFSHIYRDKLRVVNQRSFRDADGLARSIRQALFAVQDYLSDMCWERSYHRDMIWGQAEWLLHQAKPAFVATAPDVGRESGRLFTLLRRELRDCRDSEGILAREDWGRDHQGDANRLNDCLENVRQALAPWARAGCDYLLTELILVARDRTYYFYGGAERPRAAQLIRVREGPALPETKYGGRRSLGQIMVTRSSGHREIWDSSCYCADLRVSWGDVSWIRNVRPADTLKTARHRLAVMSGGKLHEYTPHGGWLIDFDPYVYSGVTTVSIDFAGEIWLERFDKKTGSQIACYKRSAPRPEPFPDWASPFARFWEEPANQ